MRGKVNKYKGKGGESYYIIYDLPRDPVTGKRRQKTVRGFKTRKEAESELARLISQQCYGDYIEPHNKTLGEYLDEWLEFYGLHNLAPSTFESYRNIIVNHVKPAIGNIPLQKLQPIHIQNYYAKALSRGRADNKSDKGRSLSPTTVLFHHRVIREALQHALGLQLVSRNVADLVKPPRKTRYEMKVLPEEEIAKLLDLFKNSYLYMPVYLAIVTGMRAGEILALQWRDIDLKEGVINVRHTLRQRKAGKPEFLQPKTGKSRRPVEISPLVVRALKEHKAAQARERLSFGEGYAEYNMVCSRKDGNPIHPGSLASRFHAITRRAGFKIRFHDLRHCHATYLLKDRVSPKIVAERLGHSTTRLTLDIYSHVIPGMQREAAMRIEERLFGARK